MSDHLDRLFVEGVERPWYRSLVRNLAEWLRPPKLPPLVLTSQPVAVKDIWGEYRYGRRAAVSSTLIHFTLIGLLCLVGTSKTVQKAVRQGVRIVWSPPELLTSATLKPQPKDLGGGGGERSLFPVSRGQRAPIARRQFAPPSVHTNEQAALPVVPTIVGDEELKLANNNLPIWGDPNSRFTFPSDGPGKNGGQGTGDHGGFGPGSGPGSGSGDHIGVSTLPHIGDTGVTAPIPVYRVEPEYSDEARKARFQGTVVLQIVIDEHGIPTQFEIRQPLGLGLDAKAVEAVKQWRFRPAMKNGKPVAVVAIIHVSFHLL